MSFLFQLDVLQWGYWSEHLAAHAASCG